MIDPRPVQALLQSGVATGVFPGAVLVARHDGRTVLHHAVGRLTYDPASPAVTRDTLFDLASLTKPLVTTYAVLRARERGLLALDQPIGTLSPRLGSSPIGQATIEQLLAHATGLPGWRPLYERLREVVQQAGRPFPRSEAADLMIEWIAQEPLESPIGTKSVYSDLGFILLGRLLEQRLGQSLERWWRRERIAGREASVLDFIEQPRTPAEVFGPNVRVAPTEQDAWRGRLLQGEVHDENAWSLGGVAGHAGLFGTAAAVSQVGHWWWSEWVSGEASEVSRLVRQFTARVKQVPGSSRALGWDTPSAPSSSGQYFSPDSFGHLGFTGTSLWIDPRKGLIVVLLTNRVHPTRANDAIKVFRPQLHDAVVQACGRER